MTYSPILLCGLLLLGISSFVPVIPAAHAQGSTVSSPRMPESTSSRSWEVSPDFLDNPQDANETKSRLVQKGVAFPENGYDYAEYSTQDETLVVNSTPAVHHQIDALVRRFQEEEQKRYDARGKSKYIPSIKDISAPLRQYYRNLEKVTFPSIDREFSTPNAALAYLRNKVLNAALSLPPLKYNAAYGKEVLCKVTVRGENLDGIAYLEQVCAQLDAPCVFMAYQITVWRPYHKERVTSQSWDVPVDFFCLEWEEGSYTCAADGNITVDDVVAFFKARGILLPEDATIDYTPDTGRLTIRHTMKVLEDINRVVRKYNNFDKDPRARKKAEREQTKKKKAEQKKKRKNRH